MPSPLAPMPQPLPWVIATTPSTLGKSFRRSGEKALAMCLQTVAEQLTLEMTPM
ncbi:hypothetical protein D3C75_1270380 [compost metagenome]